MLARWLVLIAVCGGCYGDPIRNFLPGHDAAMDGFVYPDWPLADAPDAYIEPPCATIATSADVTSVDEAGAAPTPAGGALPDGTFVLTSVHAYGGSGAGLQFPKRTVRIKSSGTLFEEAYRATGDTEDVLIGGTLVINSANATLTMHHTCPLGDTPVELYTYNSGDGSLDWFNSLSGTTFVSHFAPM